MNDEKDRMEPSLGTVSDVPDAQEQESPDYLAAPKRGKGVRRLNKVPMLVVGGLLGLTVIGISYTFYQRQQAQLAHAKAPVEQPPVAVPAVSPLKPTDSDVIGPATPLAPPVEMAVDQPAGTAPLQPGAAAPAPAPSEAYQKHMELIRRIEDQRMSQWASALAADGGVAAFASNASGQHGTQPGGSMPTGAAAASQEMQRYLAGLQAGSAGAGNGLAGAGGFGGGMGGGMGGGGMNGFGGGDDMVATNRQAQKQAFLAGSPEADTYLAAQRKAAVSISQELKAGTIIPGVMISGLNSDLPGQLIGQVRENVYDSATGTQLLIPAGSRLVGTYDSGVTLGQKRALVGWSRIIFPDSSSISLANMPGADLSGYAGFQDKVDNHYWRIFGNGLLLSVFSAGIQIAQNDGSSSSGDTYDEAAVLRAETGRQMGQLGMAMAQRNMSIQPTIQIRPGYQFNVMVTKDVILPTWRGHPMAARR